MRFMNSKWELMKKYYFEIKGNNFLINLDGQLRKCGFFQRQVVMATSLDIAKEKAKESIMRDEELQGVVFNQSRDEPEIVVEEIDAFEYPECNAEYRSGRAWYEGTD